MSYCVRLHSVSLVYTAQKRAGKRSRAFCVQEPGFSIVGTLTTLQPSAMSVRRVHAVSVPVAKTTISLHMTFYEGGTLHPSWMCVDDVSSNTTHDIHDTSI